VFWCVIDESQPLALESQNDRTRRAVSMLADDDLSLALFRRIFVIDFIAVDENNQIGILLNGT
jgi:hypothetical protein